VLFRLFLAFLCFFFVFFFFLFVWVFFFFVFVFSAHQINKDVLIDLKKFVFFCGFSIVFVAVGVSMRFFVGTLMSDFIFFCFCIKQKGNKTTIEHHLWASSIFYGIVIFFLCRFCSGYFYFLSVSPVFLLEGFELECWFSQHELVLLNLAILLVFVFFVFCMFCFVFIFSFLYSLCFLLNTFFFFFCFIFFFFFTVFFLGKH